MQTYGLGKGTVLSLLKEDGVQIRAKMSRMTSSMNSSGSTPADFLSR
jgi:hypothetical protein